MTISYPSGGARVEVAGNGVSSTVAVPFAFWLGSDLRVIHTDAFGVDTDSALLFQTLRLQTASTPRPLWTI